MPDLVLPGCCHGLCIITETMETSTEKCVFFVYMLCYSNWRSMISLSMISLTKNTMAVNETSVSVLIPFIMVAGPPVVEMLMDLPDSLI